MKITIVEYTKKRKELVLRLCYTIMADALTDKNEQELKDQRLILNHIQTQLKNGIISKEDIEDIVYDPTLFICRADIEMLFDMLNQESTPLRIVR